MAKAVWNGTVIAQSDATIMVEGNHYFPKEGLLGDHFLESTSQSVCPWKGVASYYDVTVDGQTNRGAAWYYPDPKPAATDIRDYVAFWRGVRVED